MIDLVKHVNEIAERTIEEYADRIAGEMKANAPVKSGTLKGSISVEYISPTERFIGSDLEYAKWVENGRGEIFPKYAKALKFEANGKTIFAKHAKAYKGSHFVRKTANKFK